VTDKHLKTVMAPLPAQACLPINRCNLPCKVLGSLQFQHQPQPLYIDGVRSLHYQLFQVLDGEADAAHRARLFTNHMAACFQLHDPEAQGYNAHSSHPGRFKADYLQLLRGWLFNADGREAAVLKGWVESRFGLQTRNHGRPITDTASAAYERYQAEQAHALYNTNALHSQLDVLYSYCQYELHRQHGGTKHLSLYRGVNRLEKLEVIGSASGRRRVVLLNNISSFTSSRERADEFGDQIISTQVPLAKLLFVPGLIPGLLQGEQEHLVIGGLYEVALEGL
jgi:NAD+--dinitrogen-reductase ADP-D-ribosyltransferase